MSALLERLDQHETQQAPATIYDLVARQQPEIERALRGTIDSDGFIRTMITQLRTTPRLAECTPASVIAAMMQAAQLGLEINPTLGHAWLIPRWSKQRQANEATFQIGYQGLIELAGRAGITVSVATVRTNDRFTWRDGLTRELVHEPALTGDPGTPYAWFGIARFADGREPAVTVMTLAQIHEIRDRHGAEKGPWVTDFDAMAAKTVAIRLLKMLPSQVETGARLATALSLDTDAARSQPELPPLAAGTLTGPALAAAGGGSSDTAVDLPPATTDPNDFDQFEDLERPFE